MLRQSDGFSLVEFLVAMALTTIVVAGVFAVVQPAQSVFAVEPERADIQQRLRIAVDTLTRDLAMAGSGPYLASRTGSLAHAFPPLLPFRIEPGGSRSATIAADAVTTIAVPTTAAQTTLAADLLPGVLTLQAVDEPSCPAGIRLCGFGAGLTIAIYDAAGNFDLFTVGGVADDLAQITLMRRSPASSPTTYRAGSTIVEVRAETYGLKRDVASHSFQLTVADSPDGSDLPVLDHIVGLAFDYDAEPRPPAVTLGVASYGPSPPAVGIQTSGYPAGENCAFRRDPVDEAPLPRLSALASGTALVPLTTAQMGDGPWCPDETSENRWDADLLRIRRVRVTLRVEAAVASLRGPAGALFTNGGSATSPIRWIPDQQIRFTVSPRNLNVGRQ